MNLNGAILINKEPGPSSAGVIEELKVILAEHLKVRKKELPPIGHTGTLDPFASGLLIVCIGEATKISRYLLGSDKSYEALIQFGVSNTCGDVTEPLTETGPIPLDRNRAEAETLFFTKNVYQQVPPMHSAKKKNGRPLYELAREGLTVEREPVACRVFDFDILEWTPPRARFSSTVSAGTYIRTLAQDWAIRLGTVGVLETLHRTSASGFEVQEALTLQQIRDRIPASASNETPVNPRLLLLKAWVDFDELLKKIPQIKMTREAVMGLIHGKKETLRSFDLLLENDLIVAATYQNHLAATLCRKSPGAPLEIERVFANHLRQVCSDF
jgi:tRNA pseudouridine55 synthase